MDKKTKEYYTIDLLHIMKSLAKRAWLIIMAAFVSAFVGFSIAAFVITPTYSSSVMLYVNNASFSLGNTSFSISASEINAAQSLVKTYSEILNNRTTLERIIDKAGVDYTYQQLSGMIKAASSNETEIMKVTVTCEDPYEAAKIANCIAEELPIRINDIIDGATMEVVDSAVPNLNKVNPSITKYTAIGLLLGLLVVIGNADMISSDVVPELKNMILEMQASGEIVLDEGISMQYVFDIIDWAAKYIVVIMAVVIVIMVCAIVVSYFNMKMYKSITLFVQNLESTSITYAYISPAKFSAKLIKVMGIINIIAAAPTALGAGIGAIAPVMQGVLLIITSNLFREIDTRLEANAKDVFEQRRILENMMAYYRNKENSRESVEN